MREFEIKMVILDSNNEHTVESINDLFIEWIESLELSCGGSVIELKNNE